MVVKKKLGECDSGEIKSFETPDENTLEKDNLDPILASLRITAIYIFVGALWILLSDKMLVLLVSNKEAVTNISIIKGWIYVAVTGALIYSLVYSAFNRIKKAESKLCVSYQSLSETNMELVTAHGKVAESNSKLKVQDEKLMENQQRLTECERELQHKAYYDQITGVQNRLSLINYVDKLITSERMRKIALLIVDVDNFKYINDTMGHSFGDQLLIEATERLASLAESNCTIYRISGDEFVILLEGFEDSSMVERLAVKLLKGFKSPLDIKGSSMFITISIGISLYPEQGDSLDELLKSADIALYKAKETGRNRIVFYTKPMNEAVLERVLIEKHLRTALDNNEFELHYQPQLDIAAQKVSGFEALIRWKSPELGYVSPLRFISIAEDTHMIIPIGEWVLRNACMCIKGLHQQGYDALSMSVNISMLQLLQDDFVDKVIEILAWSELDPKHLELEITESILMESYEAIAGKLKLLKERGIKLALDDFGKGYSSLNYLRQLPISTLKIDKSFIDTIGSTSKHKSLTNLMVKIGRTMGMCVVAEGVETQEQLDYLVKHKCDKIQGYLFGKPVPGEKVVNTLMEQAWSI
ncbi:MAG: putative bifunctional diguanylate cyclase/phosphodiesterase [Clostridia bacterium]